MDIICIKHKYKLKGSEEYSTGRFFYFECEKCGDQRTVHQNVLWPRKPRVLRDAKIESISINSTGMGSVISIDEQTNVFDLPNEGIVRREARRRLSEQMQADIIQFRQRDLLSKRRRGW